MQRIRTFIRITGNAQAIPIGDGHAERLRLMGAVLAKAIEYILENGNLTIKDFKRLCPGVNRRSLQRDLKAMIDKQLLVSEGATNQLIYRLKR